MKHQTPGYLCLSDLLDQDLSAYEYFQSLPPDVREALKREDGVTNFDELQAHARHLAQDGLSGDLSVF